VHQAQPINRQQPRRGRRLLARKWTVGRRHYNYFRDYEPRTGRYVESDPIGLLGGPSSYAYVLSNPLVAIDWSGEASVRLPFPSDHYESAPGQGGGKIECDGFHEIRIVIGPLLPLDAECGVGDCIRAHEEQHSRDAFAQNPFVCTDFSGFPAPSRNAITWGALLDWTEERAHKKSAECLRTKNLTSPCKCKDRLEELAKEHDDYAAGFGLTAEAPSQ